ncbi:hypothetical protein QR680_012599 [Steinernema hermaphroditum]|uniref:Nucleolar protein 14 n=1 Tax=Steinernema hermaphroditum TaxID=289476 RepID=A0AA39I2I3_9BILA|nr:hypothetical protein QR680_012599 [Steinernema hermaphroditum]
MAPGKRGAGAKKPKGVTKPKGPGQFKKSISEKKVPRNPFELKFNRQKHNVLGTKKTICGAPGASKKNAIENRRKTLQIEYKHIGKVNEIVDKRFGEGDTIMTTEEKAAKRFALQRSLAVKKVKKSKYLLEDDQEDLLTHKGHTLSDVSKYDKSMVSDDEDDEDTGNLHGNVVSIAHFGGGWMRKDGEEGASTDPKASRKDLIMDLIARSKLIKQEKQTARDEIQDTTEELDEKWKSLLQSGVVKGFAPGINKHADAGIKKDSYDDLFRELQLNGGKRADPQDKLKSAKELAGIERERLEELEKKRLARMNPEPEKKKGILRSADEDIDGISKSKKLRKGSDRFVVRYDADGKLLRKDELEKASIKKVRIEGVQSDSEFDDEEDMESDDGEEELGEDDGSEEIEGEEGKEGTQDSEGENEAGDVESAEAADIDEIEVDDFETMAEGDDDNLEELSLKKPVASVKEAGQVKSDDPSLPYVFDLPQSYKQLAALLDGHTGHDQGLIIERITKCHHPSLKEGNKQKLSKLFVHLLRHYDSLASSQSGPSQIKILGELFSPLYKLMKYDVDYAARAMRALLMNKKKRRGPHEPPSFAVIAFFQVVAQLFPVSDRFHPVCSPAMAFAMEILSTSHVTSLKDCARLLLLCTILSEWVADSKRYLPEVIAFIRGTLLLAVNNSEDEQFPSTAFPISDPHRRMLLASESLSNQGAEPLSLTVVFSPQKNTSDAFKVSVVRCALGTLNRYMMIYSGAHASSFSAIFKPFESLVQRLPSDQYPEEMQTEITCFLSALQSECQKRSAVKHLHRVTNNIKMIEMLEPKIDVNFDPERSTRSKESKNDPNAERKKLQHKVKREFRGAVRELRKDAQFVARQKRTDRMRVDREREEKTKKILHGLQFQESEHKKRMYEKKYKRF